MKRKNIHKLEVVEIESLMTYLGLRQQEFAGLVGVSQSLVSGWLNRRNPKPISNPHQKRLVDLWDETFRLEPAQIN